LSPEQSHPGSAQIVVTETGLVSCTIYFQVLPEPVADEAFNTLRIKMRPFSNSIRC